MLEVRLLWDRHDRRSSHTKRSWRHHVERARDQETIKYVSEEATLLSGFSGSKCLADAPNGSETSWPLSLVQIPRSENPRKMKWLFEEVTTCWCSFVAINKIEQNLVPAFGCHYKQKPKTYNTGLWTQQWAKKWKGFTGLEGLWGNHDQRLEKKVPSIV